jgi:hypothetical protein
MHDRHPPDSSYIIHDKRLFQEWIVDQFVKVETQRLLWLKQNQNTLCADLYSGLEDAMAAGDNNLEQLGRRIILPSSHIGSPRFFRQLYQDAMAIVQARGRPDSFVTITCDPNWEEITEALKPGEVANDRPDILSRVFRMKLNFLLELLLKDQIFGKVIGHIHVIEFQKRGLPHAHILLIVVREEDKPRTTEDYDKIVSAEIPDPTTHPRLYEVITRTMMHGPCGQAKPNAPCMRNGFCRFSFPKQFCEETTLTDDNSYPVYRQRNNGRTFEKDGFLYDNCHVAPYNAFLSLKLNCHVNVEVCSGISAVKYIYNYVYLFMGPLLGQNSVHGLHLKWVPTFLVKFLLLLNSHVRMYVGCTEMGKMAGGPKTLQNLRRRWDF